VIAAERGARTEILIVAGEASGDLHGSRLMAALAARRPELRFFGLGGDDMLAARLEAVAHSREISVVGLTEVVRILPRARRIFHALLGEAAKRRPGLAILIDSPGFNLRLARVLWRRGVPVVYYVSPQVWAWHRSRVKGIARWVSHMLVLFPFEVDFYRQYGVPVTHVGHPLVDEVPELPQAWDRTADRRRRLALLPGSRDSEVEALLPLMVKSAARLVEEAGVEVRLVQAPTVDPEVLDRHLAAAAFPVERIRGGGRLAALADSHLALCASGTATLELGLLGTPMVVLYRVGRLTALLGRMLVRVPHISLVNLVLERRVVPELMQEEATVERIVPLATGLLAGGEAVKQIRQGLRELRPKLGRGGASGRAADVVVDLLERTGEPKGSAR
jgi:lipid-A-disaccharide synthase